MRISYSDLALPEDEYRLGIAFLGIHARTRNALYKAGIVDVAQCQAVLDQKLKVPGMAKRSVEDLRLAVELLLQQVGSS